MPVNAVFTDQNLRKESARALQYRDKAECGEAARGGVSSRPEIEYSVHLDEHDAGPMTERHSIAEARRNFPSLVHDAENGKAVEITRRGEPVAVLIGHHVFERLAAGRRGFSEAYREFADSVDLRELELDPEELFGDLREEASGREVRL